MRLVCRHPALLLPLLASLALTSCTQQTILDCTALLEGRTAPHSADSNGSGINDSLGIDLYSACGTFRTLRKSLEQISPASDSTEAHAARIRSVLELDRSLHQLLAKSASNMFSERSPVGFQAILGVLASTVDLPDTADHSMRSEMLSRHDAQFDSARTQLEEWMASEQLAPAADTVVVELSLIDSLHSLLHVSLWQEQTAGSQPGSPEQDSLDTVLTRLTTLRTVRAEAVAALFDEIGGALGPLGGTGERAKTSELAWQMGLAVQLLRSTLDALHAAVQLVAEEAEMHTGLRLHDNVNSLIAAAEALDRSTAELAGTLIRASAPDEDSLRIIHTAVRQDLLWQERSLASLRETVAGVSPAMPAQGALQHLIDAADAVENVHRDLGSMNEVLSAQFGTDLQRYGLKLFLTVLFVLLSLGLIRAVIWLLTTASERSASKRLFYKRLIPIARLLVLAITTYIVLAYVFQLDQRSLLAAGAAIGVAVGFAAQSILKNIFGGIVIIFDQPFQVGDKILVGGTYGEVVSIGLRATRIITLDNNLVTVPNAHVIDSQISNANAGALHCQVVVGLYVPGWADIARVKAIAYNAAANSKYVFLGKPIVVRVKDEFKETFLTRLVVKAFVLDARHESAFASDVTEAAKAEFKKQGFFTDFEGGKLPGKAQ